MITLAIGIGANTTIFSAAEALLLHPLPFRDPSQLVIIQEANDKNRSLLRNPQLETSLEWKRATRSFERMEMAVPYFEDGNLVATGEVERIRIQYVTPGLLLPLLGVRPRLGRDFVIRDALAAGEDTLYPDQPQLVGPEFSAPARRCWAKPCGLQEKPWLS